MGAHPGASAGEGGSAAGWPSSRGAPLPWPHASCSDADSRWHLPLWRPEPDWAAGPGGGGGSRILGKHFFSPPAVAKELFATTPSPTPPFQSIQSAVPERQGHAGIAGTWSRLVPAHQGPKQARSAGRIGPSLEPETKVGSAVCRPDPVGSLSKPPPPPHLPPTHTPHPPPHLPPREGSATSREGSATSHLPPPLPRTSRTLTSLSIPPHPRIPPTLAIESRAASSTSASRRFQSASSAAACRPLLSHHSSSPS